ncbi:hypothetical protein GCM10025882_03970 [Acinetobacter gyllenbergii]|nr:hypothetical protein GCM10025882_03970 [Acinetobacter gyllenbergii]
MAKRMWKCAARAEAASAIFTDMGEGHQIRKNNRCNIGRIKDQLAFIFGDANKNSKGILAVFLTF